MTQVEAVLTSISKTLLRVRRNIDNGQPATLVVSNRHSGSQTRTISFPGRTSAEAHQFTALLKILDIIHDCIATNNTITKRDLYYRYVTLFRNQATVDRLLDDLAATLGVARSELNVVGASKGLMYGGITLRMRDGTYVEGIETSNGYGVLIPPGNLISSVHVAEEIQRFIVIEKEAVFKTVCTGAAGFLKTRCGYITGKGYPDISARELCCRLAQQYPKKKILCLVDFDPDGYQILSTYRNGSQALAHEDLAVRNFEFLGLKVHDLPTIIRQNQRETDKGTSQFMFMSSQDRRKAQKMLHRLKEDEELW